MALIHSATISPTKLELLAAWLPGRSWFTGDPNVRRLGAYRFDDPAGEVGLEALIVRSDGPVLHTPLTYRDAPLAGADDFLVGTTEHSVLGKRWVYDGCADPVWVAAAASVVVGDGGQAEEIFATDGQQQRREPSATVAGSGSAGRSPVIDAVTCHDDGGTTVVRGGGVELVVVRVVGTEISVTDTLTGAWSGGSGVLAGIR
ncbi:CG0192-related protein [Fodinicola acaciae]|uniref:CG0192-related protein n=1 Tax=Fodinicola acaciae TaxID=2681555 RepID=UPI0013D41330|nr:hypothetical protein [Fodinicola acaciae]